MAQIPNITPFDYSTAYSRLGGALADIPKSGVQGFMRGKELEFADKREDRAASKEKRDEAKFKLDEKVVLEQLENIKNKKDRRKAIQKLAIDTILDDNPDISAQKLAQLDSTISSLSFDDVGTFMKEYAEDRQNVLTHKNKWGKTVTTVDTPIQSYLQKGTAASAQKTRENGVNAYLTKGLQERARQYIQDKNLNKGNPNEEQFFQLLLKDFEGTEMAKDPALSQLVKDGFPGWLDLYKAETGRQRANIAAQKADPGVEAVNNDMLIRLRGNLQTNTTNANKLSNFDKSLLNNPGQWVHGEKFKALSDTNQTKALNVAKERIKLNRMLEMTKIATTKGIKLSEVRAETLIDDIYDADGPSSDEAKAFAAEMGVLSPGEPPGDDAVTPPPKVDEKRLEELRTKLGEDAYQWATTTDDMEKLEQVLQKAGIK